MNHSLRRLNSFGQLSFRPLSKNIVSRLICPWVSLLALMSFSAGAQTNLSIYTDRLVNGFQDWSWASHNLANTSPVHSGLDSISVSDAAWTGIAFEQAGFNNYQNGFSLSGYTNLIFWANGGTSGGQQLQITVQYGASSTGPAYSLPALSANSWQQYVVPLTALGVAGVTNANRFTWQITSYGSTATFYLDDIALQTSPGPGVVHIGVNPSKTIRTADSRWFGFNTAVWDGYLDTTQTVNLLTQMGASALRFPGGSTADGYNWATGISYGDTFTWASSFANFAHVATNAGVQPIITVNYGTGTPAEAAAWVRSANLTNHLGIKYWEIGNEVYGTWETDTNTYPNDPYTYAVRAQQYIQQMKAADPAVPIEVGVVATPGEDSYVNYTTHAATNALTGKVHYGWTAVMLATLKSLGVTPDFLINHRYPEYSTSYSSACADSDALLLQSTPAWSGDAADLRAQINGYMGATGTNIELLTTENNSDSGAQGRQSTSLVNALYYADSLGQIMQTEFNGYFWWDLRNGSDNSGSFDASLYGWQSVGDFGVIANATNCYPAFYAAKIMSRFVRGGETILGATNDFSLLSTYASRHADGSVSLLVINKDAVTNLTGQVSLNSFVPGTNAAVYSFGIPQDHAAQTGVGATDVLVTNTSISGSSFSYQFPPYSLTLFTFSPAAPRLLVTATNANILFQLQGQPSVPYILQTSTNLMTWTSNATVTLTGTTWNWTNSAAATQKFWRAVWLP